MAKKITALIKLALPAGKATPAPPVGPALGQHGVNIAAFCKEYNARTNDKAGLVIPVEISVYEDRSYTWSEVYKRCIKFASALEKIGVVKGDTVSVMAFNTPEIFEAHYSVPMTGAILNTINTRLDAKTVAYILDHCEAKVLIIDRQLHSIIEKALDND